jgi:hypothetical protein
VPRPFVGYLRVYEPLSAFDAPLADRLRKRVADHALVRSAVGEREQELWLRSQISVPSRLLPGETADGQAAPNAALDVLVLQPAEVPTSDSATVGPGPLVCPLDLRPRAAAALVGFLSTTMGVLRTAALSVDPDRARGHANGVIAAEGAASVHVISSTWTIPLPWFTLVNPDERHVVLGRGRTAGREVYWPTPDGGSPTPTRSPRRRSATTVPPSCCARRAGGSSGSTRTPPSNWTTADSCS